jgi:hypothetical protein
MRRVKLTPLAGVKSRFITRRSAKIADRDPDLQLAAWRSNFGELY